MKERNILTLVLVVCCSFMVSAQGPPPPPPPPGLPIDGGVLFLLIAGLYYGVKKVRD